MLEWLWLVGIIWMNIVFCLDIKWCIIVPTLHIRYNQTCNHYTNYSSQNISFNGMKGEYENVSINIRITLQFIDDFIIECRSFYQYK